MENTSLSKQIGLAFLEALNGKNGPLYVGIAAISGLVLGWKFLDDNYRYQNGNVCVEPATTKTEVTDDTFSTVEEQEEDTDLSEME